MITYLLPLLIANTGGRMVYGVRGGVVGTIATMGVIVGTDIPMFIGAMIMGPLGGLAHEAGRPHLGGQDQGRLRDARQQLLGRHPRLASSRSAPSSASPRWSRDSARPSRRAWTGWSSVHLLPLRQHPGRAGQGAVPQQRHQPRCVHPDRHASSRSRPASPSCSSSRRTPAPALGILLALAIFGLGAARASAPGAFIIQFFGGIHEIYFPYVLMKPILIIAAILGGMTGVAVNVAFQTGPRERRRRQDRSSRSSRRRP